MTCPETPTTTLGSPRNWSLQRIEHQYHKECISLTLHYMSPYGGLSISCSLPMETRQYNKTIYLLHFSNIPLSRSHPPKSHDSNMPIIMNTALTAYVECMIPYSRKYLNDMVSTGSFLYPLFGITSNLYSHWKEYSLPWSNLKSTSYGLCWHFALFLKAMATAWDLITQTDLWQEHTMSHPYQQYQQSTQNGNLLANVLKKPW